MKKKILSKMLMLFLTIFISIGMMANESYSQAATKDIAIEFNGGSWIAVFGPTIDVDWNFGGTFGFANGLALHGELAIHTKSIATSLILKGLNLNDQVSISGFGGGLGIRYFFGNSGLNGFYIGPKMIFGKIKVKADAGSGLSGSVQGDYVGVALDLGARFIIFDPMTLTIGLSGGLLNMNATGSITLNGVGTEQFGIGDLKDIPYANLVIALGVTF